MSFFLPPQEKKHSRVVLRDFIGLTVVFFFKSTQYSLDIFTVQILVMDRASLGV